MSILFLFYLSVTPFQCYQNVLNIYYYPDKELNKQWSPERAD